MKNKKRINEILKDPMGKIICVDLDGTLCEGTFWKGMEHPPVNKKVQELVWDLDDRGGCIIIWTARPLILLSKTYKWLGSQNLHYPIALRNKPPADLYIDDKCINIDDLV